MDRSWWPWGHRVRWRGHKLAHEHFSRWYDPPTGYFGCRVCDREWLEEHPEDRDRYDEEAGEWI